MRSLYRGRSRLVILMMAMLCVTLLTSCKPKEPDWSEEYVLEPHVIRTYQSEDWVWAGDPSRAISPDGKWLLSPHTACQRVSWQWHWRLKEDKTPRVPKAETVRYRPRYQ